MGLILQVGVVTEEPHDCPPPLLMSPPGVCVTCFGCGGSWFGRSIACIAAAVGSVINHTSVVPDRSESKIISVPSGDHAGSVSAAGSFVSRAGADPSAFIM